MSERVNNMCSKQVEEVPFGELFAEPTRNGLTRPKSVRGTGTKMVNMGELFAHPRISHAPMDRVPLSDLERERFLLNNGDLLFARQSLVLEGAGKCSIFLQDNEPVTFESHVTRVRLDSQKANPLFYFYYFQSQPGKSVIRSIVEQGAGASGIRGSDLATLSVQWLPVETQNVAAEMLGILDDKIELNHKVNETLEAMARALFKSWFVDFDPVRAKAAGSDTGLPAHIADLFPDALVESPLGLVPKGWNITTWRTVATLEYGKSLSGYNTETGKYPVYGTNGRIGTCSKPLCPYPGVIVGRKGAYRGVHYSPSPFFAIDTAFYVAPKIPVELRWVYYELLRLNINSMDSGSAIPSTSREDFYSLPVVVPHHSVQQCFADLMGPSWRKQEQNRQSSLVLAELRVSLLPALISGKLRINSDSQVGTCL